MAPSLNHPPGLNFFDDYEQKPVHVDAEQYYGGPEYHSRARTYSHVRVLLSPNLDRLTRFIFSHNRMVLSGTPLKMTGISGHDGSLTTRRAALPVASSSMWRRPSVWSLSKKTPTETSKLASQTLVPRFSPSELPLAMVLRVSTSGYVLLCQHET